MKMYRVTVTYLTIVEAEDEEDAMDQAQAEIERGWYQPNDFEVEPVES